MKEIVVYLFSMNREITEALKLTFRERCMDLVRRGLGQVALSSDVTVEASYVPEDNLVAYTTIQHSTDEAGKQQAVWTDLLLDATDTMTKHHETTHPNPRPGDKYTDEPPTPLCNDDVEAAIRTMECVLQMEDGLA